MGHVDSIGFDRWPAQGRDLNTRVTVCFDYDTSRTIGGLVVRDDKESPGRMLIRLDDGRIVDATECQYRPAQFDPCADATAPTDAALRRVVEAARECRDFYRANPIRFEGCTHAEIEELRRRRRFYVENIFDALAALDAADPAPERGGDG